MRWLIVEDALRDRKGHWFEYIRTFRKGLLELGDTVTILADRDVEPDIQTQLNAQAVLPESIWHRMGDGGSLKRYLRVPVHALKTRRSIQRVLKKQDEYDLIFVPTVSVHHLLGWLSLIEGPLRKSRARILLYFLSVPVRLTPDGKPQWVSSLTTRLLARLFESLRPFVETGKVVIGVETSSLQKALAGLTRLPVTYLPQPVEPLAETTPGNDLLMACYGAARDEKGSELLQNAIEEYVRRYPASRARFAIQWIEDFRNGTREWVRANPQLEKCGRVEYIKSYFKDGEYPCRLAQTQVMLLPYRRSSYSLRGSRVLIEAMVNGLPSVTTSDTTLSRQSEEFGATVSFEDGNLTALVEAIHAMEKKYQEFQGRAESQKEKARNHFSVREFRRLLNGPATTIKPDARSTNR